MLFRSIQPRRTSAWGYVFLTAMLSPVVLSAQAATTTLLALSSSQVAAGTAVQLTATVEAGTQPVSPGQVLFYDGKTLLSTAQLLHGGTASVKLRFGPGAHSLTVSFAGTKLYAKSSSGSQSLLATAALVTSTALSTSGTNPYTLTATVTGSGLPAPGGSVTFIDQSNNMAVGSAALGTAIATQTLQPQTTFGTALAPESSVVGDFNGDGIPDLAVSTNGVNGVSVFLGKGDGAFQPQATYATGDGPWSVASADFNGDGIPDLVTANIHSNTVSVLLGNGDGAFQAQVIYPTGSGPRSVEVGDFNNDGIPDLATANSSENTVSVLLGNADGTFQAPATYITGSTPGSVAVGDFNNDGIQDLATANSTYDNNTVSVLLGRGDGTFAPQTSYGTGGYPWWVTVGDFNRDGVPDLVVANGDDNTVSVLLGKGDGTFQPQATYATGAIPRAIVVGDFNDDGIPDLVVANTNDKTVSLLLGNGDGTFQAQIKNATGQFPSSVGAADFNGDGILDLAVVNNNDSTLSLLLNSITQTASATLSNAQVVGTGTHSLEASYPGDMVYAASSATTGAQSAPLATTLALSAPSTATTGEAVQLVASLSPYADSNLSSNGEPITFKDGSIVLGTAPLNGGTATLSVMLSTGGPHVLQASYAGDTNFLAANSNSATVTVTQADTFTITPTPGTEMIKRGIVGGFILTLKSVNGFSGSVKLSCSGGPPGSYCLDLPLAVNLRANGTGYAVSGILFPRDSAPGTYTITFTGTSGTLAVTSTAKFIVQ